MDQTSDIRIVIADDHPIFRRGLKEVIESDPRLKVIAEASDGKAAIELIEFLKPEVAVLDIDMPERNGFAVARDVHEKKLPTATVFLTMYREGDALDKAIELGVKGYVLKDGAAGEIVAAVRSVWAGGHYISPALSSFLVDRMERISVLSQDRPGLKSLTPTERKVLRMISEKKTTKQIAAELFVSPRTIDNHRSNICLKLDLQGSNALLKFALEHKADLI